MTWASARAALVGAIEGAGYDVFTVPPASPAALGRGISVIMVPPARTTERRPSCSKQKRYTQRIVILHPWAAGVEETAGLAVDAAVEAIDNALDGAIKLGGAAVVAQPPEWDDAFADVYPPQKGTQEYVQMIGSMVITLRFQTNPEA